jgi:hypothetical protein
VHGSSGKRETKFGFAKAYEDKAADSQKAQDLLDWMLAAGIVGQEITIHTDGEPAMVALAARLAEKTVP